MYVFQYAFRYTFVGGILLLGLHCQSLTEKINVKSQSVKTNIFKEVISPAVAVEEYTTLALKFSLKTNPQNDYWFNTGDPQAKQTYKLLVNIDGQAASWEIPGRDEDSKTVNLENDKEIKNSENGKGFRYTLNKVLRLKPGKHNIFISLPEDQSTFEFIINLNEGKSYMLKLDPRYNIKRPSRQESFLNDIRGFDVYLNDKLIRKVAFYHHSRSGRRG